MQIQFGNLLGSFASMELENRYSEEEKDFSDNNCLRRHIDISNRRLPEKTWALVSQAQSLRTTSTQLVVIRLQVIASNAS